MNPYQAAFEDAKKNCRGLSGGWEARGKLTKQYAWAIPNEEALAEIRKHEPLIEIGAGKGYWASLLDVDIICFDSNKPEDNHYIDLGESYHKVAHGGHERILEHPARTLFLCWPPYDTPMAADCLKVYTGGTLVFIGEGPGGCTADSAFWEAIENEWELECDVSIPYWSGIHDDLVIYKRKSV